MKYWAVIALLGLVSLVHCEISLGRFHHLFSLFPDISVEFSRELGGSLGESTIVSYQGGGLFWSAGFTNSADFPLKGNAIQTTFGGVEDIVIYAYDVNGISSCLFFSTLRKFSLFYLLWWFGNHANRFHLTYLESRSGCW